MTEGTNRDLPEGRTCVDCVRYKVCRQVDDVRIDAGTAVCHWNPGLFKERSHE